ncbi:hypothetical protein AWB81_07693 [Caballeronia arationis]|uniref:Uncharacterized protein n=1 Tax=Caballeronia arationis TaxID=1777142 RepID=A0A7Z7I8H4_9BURK|nr:hypothetical protein AWB81_07693 [Caballeronia arationis]SOE81257.1 hypothetical protein SAMN05446927_4528 [Caballeronia arationis]
MHRIKTSRCIPLDFPIADVLEGVQLAKNALFWCARKCSLGETLQDWTIRTIVAVAMVREVRQGVAHFGQLCDSPV